MFNLEQAMADWRRQMLAAGIKAPVPLEELEGHLRDEVEQQRRLGLDEERAFHAAVRQMGQAGTLKTEFNKVQSTNQRKHMLKTCITLTALFGSVLGGAMVLPALGRWQQTGTLILGPLILGATLAIIAGGAAYYGVSRQHGLRGRKLISAGIVAAGGFYLVPLGQAFFRSKIDLAGWWFCLALAVASLLFYGACFRLNRREAPKSP